MKKPWARTAAVTRDQRDSLSRHPTTPQGPQVGPAVGRDQPLRRPWYMVSDRWSLDLKEFLPEVYEMWYSFL